MICIITFHNILTGIGIRIGIKHLENSGNQQLFAGIEIRIGIRLSG